MNKLLHVGIVSDPKNSGYMITAEFLSGYLVIERFKTLEDAKAALPKIKREVKAEWRGNHA